MSDDTEKPNACETETGRHEIFVAPEEAGMRLDRLLANRLPTLSRRRIKSLIAQGALKNDGRTIVEASLRVKSSQTFAIEIPETRKQSLEAQPLELDILHEDSELLVLNKPAGLVIHPAAGTPDGTLVNALLAHCGDSLRQVGGEERCGIVHRLDKDTSGVLVAAKSEAAYNSLVSQFSSRQVSREYMALAWGALNPREGEIEGNIGRSPINRKKMAVLRTGGKPARTHYRSIRSYGAEAVSQLSCRLDSGRTHQIRVHLAHAGHPLLGDPLYGRRRPALLKQLPEQLSTALCAFPRQALHARTLGFEHPETGEWIDFTTDLPCDLKNLIKLLECL
ncbi:RluA family pseudouridine synthase [Fodinicurvata sediminis]|uniref:RluA family pseudouridine synthase n=1 Tax=Fodinicurvata sediminis TaxID=1121832 RepID=UPI0003B44DEF|nr:RluA family pseudouridine synthase [Fodinicurvata sediminis]